VLAAQVQLLAGGNVGEGGIPPELVAAARSRSHEGTAVQLQVGGRPVIAVVGHRGGDPAEWWDAIRDIATGRVL